jgi:hypothetical protein
LIRITGTTGAGIRRQRSRFASGTKEGLVSISERRKNRVETPPIVSKSRRRQRRTVEAAMPHGHPFRVNTSNLPRRRFLHLAAGAAALPAVPRIARAQAYPSRTVTMVVPFAAGGTPDVVARIVGEHMSRTLGQQFIAENVPGGGGTTGSTRVMRAKSDGYTILMGGINPTCAVCGRTGESICRSG